MLAAECSASQSLNSMLSACLDGARLGLRFVLVEPAGYVQHFGDVVAGAAADAVGLFRNANEHGFDVEEFESGVKLLGFGDGSAIVGFAGHDQRGSFDFADLVG